MDGENASQGQGSSGSRSEGWTRANQERKWDILEASMGEQVPAEFKIDSKRTQQSSGSTYLYAL